MENGMEFKMEFCINALINAPAPTGHVVCCRQRMTTCLVYMTWPPSNLPSNNFNSLSTENY